MLRFHLDEHVDPAIAHGLRIRGIDATTTIDADLLRAPDEEHFAFAQQAGRVIVTHDEDFLRSHSQSVSHAGIAYCAQQTRSIGEIVRYLALMDACLSEEEMAGQVEYL